ncbi:MAG: hypothetical protein DDT39_00772 [Firmicutes bacterium]|nr:hypothetical protein [candidate division NPL-UPA2 bacterium]MBT9154106.1 hypothetical protein [candidate division NPL-UPA2 bacterium]
MRQQMPRLAFVSGLGFATIFGLSFIFAKEAIETVDPLALLAMRFSLAAGVVTVLHLIGLFPLTLRGKNIRSLLLLAAFQPVAYFLFEIFGLSLTHTSQAGMMIALIPIVVAIMSRTLLGEHIALLQGASILVSVSGVLLIAINDAARIGQGNALGLALLFMAVCSAASFNIISRQISSEFSPFESTFVMMWTGAVSFSLLALLTGGVASLTASFAAVVSSPQLIGAMLYLGVLSSVVAFFLVNYTLSRLPATQSAIFANVGTIVAVAAGVLLRNEPFHWYSGMGAAMIILGVWGANWFAARPSMSC